MMPAKDPDLRKGMLIAGYEVDDFVGSGGMARVYRAHHRHLGRQAALKIIAPEYSGDRSFRERFVREAQLAASLRHPHVLAVYDAGEAEGLLYIAMQYVDGPDLAEILEQEGRLHPERTIRLLKGIATAIDYAHHQGLIHRDVKPANILLEGEHGFLADFGLTTEARVHAAITQAGEVVGTLQYISPEQIKSEPITASSDIYAFGCVLYHCLAGHVPYPRLSQAAVIYGHLSEPTPAISTVGVELPQALDSVFSRGLAKRPEERFSSCREMIEAAEEIILAHQPFPDPSSEVSTEGDTSDVATFIGNVSLTEAPPRTLAAQDRPTLLLSKMDAMNEAIARLATESDWILHEQGADNLQEAVEKAKPDVIVVDVHAIGLEHSIVSELKKGSRSPDPLLLTIVPSESNGRQWTAAGADEILISPFSPLQFQVKLRRLRGSLSNLTGESHVAKSSFRPRPRQDR